MSNLLIGFHRCHSLHLAVVIMLCLTGKYTLKPCLPSSCLNNIFTVDSHLNIEIADVAAHLVYKCLMLNVFATSFGPLHACASACQLVGERRRVEVSAAEQLNENCTHEPDTHCNVLIAQLTGEETETARKRRNV
ncbi:hypothetical protein ILYODFUR_008680 [Ilyodon furcidens]|uniref:Secreted protein n=1 Tax=Ilyodon furcidens TaxID=33524 RepID=A0ABV0UEG2_9TELE